MKSIAILLPYVAVFIGLDLAKSAWLSVALYHAGMIFILVAIDGKRAFHFLRTGWRLGTGALYVFVAALSGAVIYLLLPEAQLKSVDLAERLMSFGLAGPSLWFFAAYFATIGAALEEVYWRGYLGTDSATIHLRDVAFAGYHLLVLRFFLEPVWLLLALAVLMTVAWAWRQAAIRLRGLSVPVVSHVVADISIMIALMSFVGS